MSGDPSSYFARLAGRATGSDAGGLRPRPRSRFEPARGWRSGVAVEEEVLAEAAPPAAAVRQAPAALAGSVQAPPPAAERVAGGPAAIASGVRVMPGRGPGPVATSAGRSGADAEQVSAAVIGAVVAAAPGLAPAGPQAARGAPVAGRPAVAPSTGPPAPRPAAPSGNGQRAPGPVGVGPGPERPAGPAPDHGPGAGPRDPGPEQRLVRDGMPGAAGRASDGGLDEVLPAGAARMRPAGPEAGWLATQAPRASEAGAPAITVHIDRVEVLAPKPAGPRPLPSRARPQLPPLAESLRRQRR